MDEPVRALADALARGESTLGWALAHAAGTPGDPLARAWARSEEAGAMAYLALRAGHARALAAALDACAAGLALHGPRAAQDARILLVEARLALAAGDASRVRERLDRGLFHGAAAFVGRALCDALRARVPRISLGELR